MSNDTILIASTIAVVGLLSVIALFNIAKAMRGLGESTTKMSGSVTDTSAKNESLLKAMVEAIVQAAQETTRVNTLVAEAITKLEQRVAESIGKQAMESKEDRQIDQSIAQDNRQALRDASQTIKERLDDLKECVSSFGTNFKEQATETRKWDATKSSERLEKELESNLSIAEKLTSHVTALNERLDSVGKQISEKLDQGARMNQKSLEAKADEVIAQLKVIPLIQAEIRSVVSQLEQSRETLEHLRKTIVADVSTLTGE